MTEASRASARRSASKTGTERSAACHGAQNGSSIAIRPRWRCLLGPLHSDLKLRPATPEDEAAILTMLPQLADFPIPPRRTPEQLWQGDATLASRVLNDAAPASFLDVLVTHSNAVVGLVLVTLRPELLSHTPSAHLEAIVVRPDHRGRGLGKWLLAHCETRVRTLGANALTLHVFDRNERAKSLYVRQGYDLELVRAVKWLD